MRTPLPSLLSLWVSCWAHGHEAPVPLPGASLRRLDTEASLAKRLDFQRGEPQISVRLMEGRDEVVFTSKSRLRMKLAKEPEKWLDAPAGSEWRLQVKASAPAELLTWVQLAEFQLSDKEGLEDALRLWASRKRKVRVHVLGSIYGIAGKVIDNRKNLLLLDEPFDAAGAAWMQRELLQKYGARTQPFEQLRRPARGTLELLDATGHAMAVLEDRLLAETTDGGAIEVKQVEYGVGYDFHGFENRRFRGRMEFLVDRRGKLAVVNLIPLEELLKGLVPAEIFPRAHPEALKAQAVTARGEVLAKIGLKHLADPYLLCAEQHCAVYKGLVGEAASTNAAVEATRGQGLFSADGRLVDSVYSAVCGGHTEHNEIVWGGPPNPSLRGRPDTLPGKTLANAPSQLSEFLEDSPPVACRTSTFAQVSKFRWERRFSMEEIHQLTAPFNLGEIKSMAVSDRGISGRARTLTLSGTQGATGIRGELNIRRLFKMLPSSMFQLEAERSPNGQTTGWVFRGGGWGHGVGMCQTGAIGRAEAGQTYAEILEHYYNGARVAPLY